MENKRIIIYLNHLVEQRNQLEFDLELAMSDLGLGYNKFSEVIGGILVELNQNKIKRETLETYLDIPKILSDFKGGVKSE